MKKFLLLSCGFLFVLITIYFLIASVCKRTRLVENNFLSAIIHKHDQIKKINNSKILFAGGSNLVFGLNSEKIEDEFSIPVVNLGLHAGLGLDFVLKELENSIVYGDVVFLSPEYFLDTEGNYELKSQIAELYPEANKYFESNFKSDIAAHFDRTRTDMKLFTFKSTADNNQNKLIYLSKLFNKNGDFLGHLGQSSIFKSPSIPSLIYKYWNGIDKINQFNEIAKTKNVSVFFLYPTFLKSEYLKNKIQINKLNQDLEKNLKIEILNSPTDLTFSNDFHFDSKYHLNKKGRDLRTNITINLIRNNKNVCEKLLLIKNNKK